MRSPPRALVAVVAGELADLAPAERQARLAALDRDDPTLARAVRARLAGGPAVADDESPAPGDMPAGVVATGARVGPYRVLRRIGRGGMATVWLAHDDRLDRPVALKVLNDAGEDDPAGDARGRFLVEARAAARLDHPHVAGVHDVGETPDGRLYIAMAYCEGGSLADRLAAGPLPADDARRVTRQLAAALGAAHARGIVHRDVKPANVLLDAAGSVRLADFGIAKLPGVDATRPGFLVGTLAYLAPEQLRGERVDHRADLWALGVTLHEMLAGRRPFAGASHAAIMRAVLDAPPDPLPAGAAPAPLAALVARLLQKDPAARPQSADEVLAALDGVGPQDSGRTTHAPPGAPPAATAPAPPPAALTPLVGRERELALAVTLLARARLVTLTGPGGTGKTRLALEVARRAEPRHADGVYVVPLAAVPAPELVASAVAQATGLQEIGSLRPDEQALRYFARRQALLVLDNFEHLADAAPFVAALLAGAPRLTILVTSRAPLHVHGEHELPVPPLGLPDPGAATARAAGDAEAVRLFVQRAAAGRPDFALTDANAADVAAICRRLDGLPLAIELAAARVKLLAPRAILARLAQRLDLLRSDARDVAPRHRTLRDVIDWSYGLLAPEEQALFRELSVFVGGFTLDSAAAVAGAAGGGDAVDVLDRVASLADKSLLVRREQPDGEPRFHMLETVREYALARLEEGGDAAAARAAHRAHFLALAEEAASHLRGPTQVAWLGRLDREHDNLRAALVDAQTADDVGAAARLGVALHRYWVITRRHLGDAVAHLAAIDARTRAGAGDRVPARTRALLLGALGLLTGVRSEFATSRRYFEESMRAYRDAGDAAGAATALNHLGWLSFLLGDLGPAESLSREALDVHQAYGNRLGVAIARVNLGWVAVARGELAEAERHFADGLALQRALGERRSCAYTASYLGLVAQRRGDVRGAVAWYDESLALGEPLDDPILTTVTRVRLVAARHEAVVPDPEPDALEARLLPAFREIGHPWSLSFALAQLGVARRDAGELAGARAALEESLALRRGMGDRLSAAESRALLADVAWRAGDRAAAAAGWHEALRERHAAGQRLGVAECAEGLAAVALGDGDAATAARLLGFAAAARSRLGAPVPARYRAEHAARDAAAERALGAGGARAARDEGAALDADAAVAVALRVGA